MSLKRTSAGAGGRSHFGGGGSDPGAKIGRQELYDELKKLATSEQVFAPADIALAIGAGEPQVAKALLGLAAEGYIEKVDAGRYKATPFAEIPQPEFVKAMTRASKTDSARQRDLSEIQRLKQNNDIMRAKLLGAIAERDHYLAVLKKQGIDPGPVPAAASPAAAAAVGSAGPPPTASVALPGEPESSGLQSGPGVTDASPAAPEGDVDESSGAGS